MPSWVILSIANSDVTIIAEIRFAVVNPLANAGYPKPFTQNSVHIFLPDFRGPVFCFQNWSIAENGYN